MHTYLRQSDNSRDLNRQTVGSFRMTNCYFAPLMVSAVT
jgi:hypothetical protein